MVVFCYMGDDISISVGISVGISMGVVYMLTPTATAARVSVDMGTVFIVFIAVIDGSIGGSGGGRVSVVSSYQ